MKSDLINRQDAIDYLMTNMVWYDENGYEEIEDEKLHAITDLINGVPSADGRRRRIMTREEAYTILDRLIEEKKIFSPTVECAIAMALDDMMVIVKLRHLKNVLTELLEEIKELEDTRGEE